MNPRTLLHLTQFLDEGHHTFEEISEKSGLGKLVVQDTLRQMADNGVGKLGDHSAEFSRQDKVASAVLAVQIGCSVDEASQHIGWRDFEEFVAEILVANGYTVKRTLRLKKPKAEIDVLAYRNGLGIAVDCKHWKRTGGASSMRKVAELQTGRAKRLVEKNNSEENGIPQLSSLYPVVATLHEENVQIINGVPVIPVTRLSGFLSEFEGYTNVLRDVCSLETE
jgi:hypothetical protein